MVADLSYVRFIEADAYMYHSVYGVITCCACSLRDADPRLTTRSEAIEHLQEHVDAGGRIPERAFKRLRQEIEELGDEIPPWDPEDGL